MQQALWGQTTQCRRCLSDGKPDKVMMAFPPAGHAAEDREWLEGVVEVGDELEELLLLYYYYYY